MAEPLVPDPESLEYEEAAVEDVAGELGGALARVLALSLAARAAGTVGDTLGALIRGWLKAVRWSPMTPILQAVAEEAVSLGVDQSLRDLPADSRPARRPRSRAPEVSDLDAVTRERIAAVVDLTRTLALETQRDLDRVLGAVSTVRSRAEGQARWTANEGINVGAVAVARSVGQSLIWLPERDACLHCLAYAGWSVRPGEDFPAGLTYSDKSLSDEPVPHPPLHPSCRCRVRPWDGPVGEPPQDRSSTSQAARLAAEARRSVVYGWTEHASHAATIRAMDRLLRAGAGLPASVERRARELVRKGRTQPRPR